MDHNCRKVNADKGNGVLDQGSGPCTKKVRKKVHFSQMKWAWGTSNLMKAKSGVREACGGRVFAGRM